MTTQTATEYRIYVASLSDYNNGNLHGRWIDADTDPDEIQAEVADMLRESKYPNVEIDCPDCYGTGQVISHSADTITPCTGHCEGTGKVASAEEWAIHDYELGGIEIGEYESFEKISELAEALEEHGAPFAAWHNYQPDYNTNPEKFQEEFNGEYNSEADFAEEWNNSIGAEIPEWLAYHIDWESVWRDMRDSFYSVKSDTYTYYIFTSN